jgi:hypothetical protein
MDRRERSPNLNELLIAAMSSHQATVWTSLPGIIESYSPAKMTVSVRPSIQARVQLEGGEYQWVSIPLLVDVPVIFPSGGGFTLTFPISPGDECLVMFASRCIDGWWQSGGVQQQMDLRMHDLSDGFALVGPRSQPRVLSPAANATAVDLRADTGGSHVRISADGSVEVKAPTITLLGDVTVTGTLAVSGASVTHQGTNIGRTHRHGGVQAGSSLTSNPL